MKDSKKTLTLFLGHKHVFFAAGVAAGFKVCTYRLCRVDKGEIVLNIEDTKMIFVLSLGHVHAFLFAGVAVGCDVCAALTCREDVEKMH